MTRKEVVSKGPRQSRGRFISRSISTSEQLASVSLLADYLFRAMLPHLDVSGRMTGNVALIKSQVVPLRDEINSGAIPELLRELCSAVDHDGNPLVFWYEIGTTKVLEFPGFERHQTGLRVDREAPSKLPPRNGKERLLNFAGATPGATPDQLRSDSSPIEVEVEVEGNGREVVTTTTQSSSSARELGVSSAGTAWQPAHESSLAARFESDTDRTALAALLARSASKIGVVSAIAMYLDGGEPVQPTSVEMGVAIRDFNANGDSWNAALFRAYVRRAVGASRKPPSAANGQAAPGDDRFGTDEWSRGLAHGVALEQAKDAAEAARRAANG